VVRRAYRDAAKRFHPDAVARLGFEDLKQQANEIFARVARANSVLSNRAQRDEYDASHSDDDQAEANRLGQAEMLFRKASIVLKAGRFTEALELLEPCVSLWPGEAQYQTELAWALFKQPKPDLARARSHLEAALALDASAALTHYRLSLVLAALGDSQKAARARATAQRLDPRVVP
jgi:curved DNA-binding protein CbpA